MERGCDGYGCVCEDSFWPNDISTQCLRAAELGEYCDSLIACRGPNLECRNGRCSCITSWTPARDGRRCKPISFTPDSDYALLGDSCNSTTLCFYANNDQQCQLGACHCKAGFRPATAVEERAFPSIPFECRQNTFSLVITDRVRQCPPTEGKMSQPVPLRQSINDIHKQSTDISRRSLDMVGPMFAAVAVFCMISLVAIMTVLFGKPSRLIDLFRPHQDLDNQAVGNVNGGIHVIGGNNINNNNLQNINDLMRRKRRRHGMAL